MNERELERLLKSYGDSVPPCVVPAIRPKPVRWPRFAAVGLATAAVAGIAVVGLWPRNAVAGSIARLHQALSDAKTMEYTVSMKIPSGWHPVLHAYYENGVWRYDTRLGTNLEYSAVNRDGMQLIDYKYLDHASLDVAPPATDQSENWQTALDFAKRSIDIGNADIQRSVKIREHDPVDGRPAYAVTMERPSDHYVANIVVDKQTNLPIESSVLSDDPRPGFGDVPEQIRTTFQFNKPLDPKIFDLYRQNRAVIRMQDARDKVKQMWRTPLGTVNGAEVRAATVSRDGTLWIATTASGDKPMLPDGLMNTFAQYVRGGDVSPAAQLNIKAYDDVFGKPIYVTAFAPMPDSGSRLIQADAESRVNQAVALAAAEQVRQATQRHTEVERLRVAEEASPVTIRFKRRNPSYVDPGRLLGQEAGQGELVTVKPIREDGDLPSYFPMLGLDRPNISLVQSILRAKAQELESSKRYELAAQTYSELAKARYDWVKYSAFQPMLDEARCYRLIGQSEKADELTQAAAVLKASRER